MTVARRSAFVFLTYLALTLAWGQFMLGSLSTSFAHDSGDPLLNAWILSWNALTVPFAAQWWDAPAYYPATGVAAFTESLVGVWPLTSPIIWLGGTSILAHNVALLVSFPLAGLGGYWLCRELTGDDLAAFVGGLAFAFAPYRVAQMPHVQVLQAYWLPVALFALHRYLAAPSRGRLILFGVAWVLNGLANGYFLLFFGVLFGLWMLWFVVIPGRWRDLANIGIATVIASVPLIAILWKYKRIHDGYGFTRRLDEIEFFSGDVAALATAVNDLSVWGWVQRFPRAEGELFPGAWLPALMIAGVCVWLHSGPARPERLAGTRWFPRLRIAAAVGAAVAFGALVVMGFTGPFRAYVWGLRISMTSVSRVLVIALVTTGFLLATRRWDSRDRRSWWTVAFYGLAAVLLWLFTLGPTPKYFGRPILGEGWGWLAPYTWLLALPGFDSLRVPTRLWTLVLVCLSVLGAYAFARLAPRRRLLRLALVLVVSAGLLSDGWANGMPVVGARRLWNCPAPQARAGALLFAPIGDLLVDLTAMDLGMQWGVPTVNGYSGHTAPHYEAVIYGIRSRDHALLDDLAGQRGLLVAVSRGNEGWHELFANHPRAVAVGSCDDLEIFKIRGQRTREPLDDQPQGAPLPIASLTADVGTDSVRLALDGDPATRWQSGQQDRRHWIYADLGQRRTVTGVVLENGEFTSDFPRRLVVEIGDAVGYWTEVWSGPTHRYVLRAATATPTRSAIALPLPPTSGRYVRLRQEGRDVAYWSIAELSLLGR